ncbi:MAG TPA: thioredoxin domain-containing protein [Pyrinomonadaceae bacterium]|jgi:protein-disulfide isomerase|nr:thioredoxin domain-containing protein [Pyrinomonadaceae bacterium]
MNRFGHALLTLALLAAPAAAQTTPSQQTQKTAVDAQASAPRTTPAPTTPATAAAAVSPEKIAADCGCEAAPLPEVVATVNGLRITKGDLSPGVRQRVAQLQQQVIAARTRELELQINSALLEAEAKRLGTTTQQVLQTEVVAKTKEPTDAEAQAFYDQNKTRIKGEFAAVKDDIKGYLRDQQQRELARKLSERLRAGADVKVLASEVTPPATPAARARLFATVGARRITSGDIEDSLRPLVFEVQQQAYELRRQDVDLKINDALLNQEAQKRQVTPRALLDAEVDSKVPAVTEAQALAFYNENKERINGEFAQVKDQVTQYLKETEGRKLLVAYAERLRQSAAVKTFLDAPEPPVVNISTDDQPAKGSPRAEVTLVEFTDFQCPNCAAAQPVFDRLLAEYGDRVRLVVRDFPLSQHPHALKAAEAAEAARAQGKYWEYAALLFNNQTALGVEQLKQYATRLGLDRAKFDAALDGGKLTEQVQRDVLDGERAGVNGTPAVFVNGRRVTDHSYDGLKAAIESTLKTMPAGR